MAYQGADETTTRKETSKGENSTDVAKRRGRAAKAGESSDKAAVREGMQVDLAAAARANAAKRAAAAGKDTGKADVDFKNLGRVAPGRKMSGRR